MTSSIAVDVSRASHAHQTPHVGRPQMAPVTSVSAVKTMLTSIAAPASRSQNGLRVRFQSHSRRGDERRAERQVQRHPRDRRMDVDEPDQVSLDLVRRCEPQPEPYRRRDPRQRRPPDDADRPSRAPAPFRWECRSPISFPGPARSVVIRPPPGAPRRGEPLRPCRRPRTR